MVKYLTQVLYKRNLTVWIPENVVQYVCLDKQAVSAVYWTTNLQLHELPLLSLVSDKRKMMWRAADALQKLQTEYHVH